MYVKSCATIIDSLGNWILAKKTDKKTNFLKFWRNQKTESNIAHSSYVASFSGVTFDAAGESHRQEAPDHWEDLFCE